MATCSIERCTDKSDAKGLCATHYNRQKRNGNPLTTVRFRPKGTTLERFGEHVTVPDADSCWLWRRPERTGYGCMTINSRKYYAHRFSYEVHVGLIPDGLVIDHLCMNKACVNPSHLEPVTSGENTRRGNAHRWRRVQSTYQT